MKRGLITWDKFELPPAVCERRLAAVRAELARHDLPALVVYTDVWRSNQGRYLTNFMPYWNRALIVIPQDGEPILLCGLSPRVYPWIKSVTILKDIRPNLNTKKLAEERGWKGQLGVLDLELLPWDFTMNASNVSWKSIHPESDDAELNMYRKAAKMAREALSGISVDRPDHEIVGDLERKLRHAGAEDLVILVTDGSTVPLPPKGAMLSASASISIALEYRGHWAKVVTPLQPQTFAGTTSKTELLSGPYPYEPCQQSKLATGSIFAAVSEASVNGKRLFSGETYIQTAAGPELL